MIDRLDKAHVLGVELSPDKRLLKLTEECDRYYHIEITRAQVIELAEDFLDIAANMVD